MIPRLVDRLDRLERQRADSDTVQQVPQGLVQAWLRAIAVALSAYPRPRRNGTDPADCLSDGFARALGYAGRQDMEAGAENDPNDWRARIAQAEASMRERYRAADCPEPGEAAFRRMYAALDEWSGAKAGNPDWPASEDATGLAHAFVFYGVESLP